MNKSSYSEGVKRTWDAYNMVPNAPIFRKEFGFYGFENWVSQGHIKDYGELAKICKYDDSGTYGMGDLGWCEAPFAPAFDTIILEDRGEYELVQDYAGRGVLYFKGRRNGFMPEYVTHPATDMKSWETNCKWRLTVTPERLAAAENTGKRAAADVAVSGRLVSERAVGGYMYLRSLIGPEDLLYKFYDEPELIHDCMQTWFNVADAVIAEHQKHVTIDEFFIAEDICFNTSSLISPDMMREFLFPYYQQIITNIKARQLDKSRRLFFQVDTDGYCDCVIDEYRSLGMDMLSPFEAASDCDVVRTAAQYPDLIMSGGIDKRILAESKEAIDRMLDRIMPPMKKRGGFIPTCDHGVPEEVSFENYIYFRQRLNEYCE